MQTFLPFADYAESARVLDYKRLGKQRVEVKQIFSALTVPGYGWRNHPATKAWAGFEYSLLDYGIAICKEWIRRGYKDSLLVEFEELQATLTDTGKPWWLGKERYHRSHRSNLLRKDPEYYVRHNWSESDELPYYWPVD